MSFRDRRVSGVRTNLEKIFDVFCDDIFDQIRGVERCQFSDPADDVIDYLIIGIRRRLDSVELIQRRTLRQLRNNSI